MMAETQAPETQDTTPLVYVREIMAEDIRAEAAENGIELPEDAILYAVHTEDGIRRAVFSDRDAAFEAAVNHGAQPVSVH
jgi:hypothetical protein